MFHALNPYQLAAVASELVLEVRPARQLERAEFLYRDESGAVAEWRDWSEIRSITINYDENGRSRPGVFVGVLKMIAEELVRWARNQKSIELEPWDPGDEYRQWISPYLRVSSQEELVELLQQDLGKLTEELDSIDASL